MDGRLGRPKSGLEGRFPSGRLMPGRCVLPELPEPGRWGLLTDGREGCPGFPKSGLPWLPPGWPIPGRLWLPPGLLTGGRWDLPGFPKSGRWLGLPGCGTGLLLPGRWSGRK